MADLLVHFRDWAHRETVFSVRGACVLLVGCAAWLYLQGSNSSLVSLQLPICVLLATIAIIVVMTTTGNAYLSSKGVVAPSWYIFLEVLMNPANIYPTLTHYVARSQRFIVVYAYGFFGPRTFFVKDETIMHHVFESPATEWEKAITGNEIYGFVSLLDGGDSNSWRHARAAFSPFFRFGFAGLQERLTAIVEPDVALWQRKRSFDLLSHVLLLVLKAHLAIFFNYSPSDAELETLVADSEYLVCMPNMTTASAKRTVINMQAHMAKALDGAPPGTFGGMIKDLQADGKMTAREAIANTGVLFLALTPAFAVFWTLLSLSAAGFNMQERARKDPIFLEMCIKETLRVVRCRDSESEGLGVLNIVVPPPASMQYPSVPNFYPRVAQKPTTIEGINFVKGDTVVVFPLWVHHNTQLWRDPSVWNPFRFSGDPLIFPPSGALPKTGHGIDKSRGFAECSGMRPAGVADAARKTTVDSRFVPFGAGRHACLGRNYAMMEVKAIVGAVLSKSVISTLNDNGLLSLSVMQRLVSSGSAYFFPSRKVDAVMKPLSLVRIRNHFDALVKSRGILGRLHTIATVAPEESTLPTGSASAAPAQPVAE